MPEGSAKPLMIGEGGDLNVGEDDTFDTENPISTDDFASDGVVMSEDVIKSDDSFKGKDQSETETEGTSSSDANRCEKVILLQVCVCK